MNYAIRRVRLDLENQTGKLETLGIDGKWYVATNQAAMANTLNQAQHMAHKYRGVIFGRDVWIEGPMGARHRIKTPKGLEHEKI